LETLHRYRDQLGRLTAPAIGSAAAVEIALSKERTLAVARQLDLPVPRSFVISNAGELDAAVAEIGVPCVLKPITSWRTIGDGGERVAPGYAADRATAERVATSLAAPNERLLVQELAEGRRETIKLFRDGSRTLARLAMVIDRTWPPLGGSSVMRQTTDIPADTVDYAERLIAEVGLEGYSEVEFRRDRRGRPLLMEINARLSQSVELACRAGIDFPRMQLEWARGGHIPPQPSAIVGLRVGWLAGELRLLVGAALGSPPPRPPLGSTLRSFVSDYLLHGARLEGFDLRDPRPMVGALAFTLRGLLHARRL
jgi:predicted ATP-grasp superfamily ATP-dependent carboligase